MLEEGLNESPSEKEGKCGGVLPQSYARKSLNESPSEKEGKCLGNLGGLLLDSGLNESPSEKEGKSRSGESASVWRGFRLNESPSEKEGKFKEAGIDVNRSGKEPQ